MSSKASTPPEPAAPPEAKPLAKTADELASEAAVTEAAEAKDSLKLFRVTATEKLLTPPHAAFALAPGANHFEGPLPDAVAERFAALQAAGAITVETLDGDGKATPWKPDEKK